MLGQVVTFFTSPDIIAATITVVGTIFVKIYQTKSCLKWGASHLFTYVIPQPSGGVLTISSQSIILGNLGNVVAENVEIYLSYKPEHFEIWPVSKHSTESLKDGSFLIKIDYIEKKGRYNLELLHSVNEVPGITKVRTKDGIAKKIHFMPQQIFPKWVGLSIAFLIILGVYKVIELILAFVL